MGRESNEIGCLLTAILGSLGDTRMEGAGEERRAAARGCCFVAGSLTAALLEL